MGFLTDKQTLDDLQIFGRHGSDSVFEIYNRTLTRGGTKILEEMFRAPLSSRETITDRVQAINYFKAFKIDFPFRPELFDLLEQYLAETDQRTGLAIEDNTLVKRLSGLITGDTTYKAVVNGVNATIELLEKVREFVSNLQGTVVESIVRSIMASLSELTNGTELTQLLLEKTPLKLSFEQVAFYDQLIRFRKREKLNQLMQLVYRIDVYIAIAKVANTLGFAFAELTPEGEYAISMEDIYHPLVKNPVGNSLDITTESNIIFLTGANMAGKSTFMKSLGIAVYLAHLGFPVPATRMSFSILDGMYTTINLPDDLSSGNSHFYAEVLRVKKIAKELGQDKKLFVIFDELFRGTNVKDAYEGTIAITQAFAEKQHCMFVVSTHIIEAGDVLKERCGNINFVYLPTKINDNTPVYTYKLETGITADRHGMVIINNERILEIIRSRKNKTIAL